jgi:DNA-binding NtrC family response regulator
VIPSASAQGLSNKNPATPLISVKKIAQRAVELFPPYPWQGNIRELQNVVQTWLSGDSCRVNLPQPPEPTDADETPVVNGNLASEETH